MTDDTNVIPFRVPPERLASQIKERIADLVRELPPWHHVELAADHCTACEVAWRREGRCTCPPGEVRAVVGVSTVAWVAPVVTTVTADEVMTDETF